jgi:hypothetical protein
LEDEATIKERRKKLPKSQVDDRFFNLSEMDAFCEAQEQEEEARRGRNLGEFRGSEDVSDKCKLQSRG